MVLGLCDLKGDFAARDVPVGSQDLPADAVFAWSQSLGLRCEGVGGGGFGDHQQLRGSVGLDQREAGTDGVDAHIEAQFHEDAGPGDDAVDRWTGFQQDGVRRGRAG